MCDFSHWLPRGADGWEEEGGFTNGHVTTKISLMER